MAVDKIDSTVVSGGTANSGIAPGSVRKTNSDEILTFEKKDSTVSDVDKPVEGYYIEKTSQEPVVKPDDDKDDDEDIDTSVDPNARINILPSIAINKTTNEITNAMEQAVNRAGAELFEKTSNNSYLKAQSMLQNNQVHQCFNEINYPKSLNLYGKIVYEGSKQKYLNNTPASESTYSINSERAEMGINWKSKSERTKAFVFGSYTHTKMNLDLELKDNSEKVLSDGEHDNSFSVYGAAEHRFKKGDLLMGSASYIDNPVESSRMTTFDAGYYLDKYMVLAEGKTTIFQLLDAKTVTKTDFSVSLNPELATEQSKANEASSAEAEASQSIKNVSKTNAKKWSTAYSPFFDTQSISGSTEEGLGLKLRLKRTDDNSNLRFAAFGKASTTQQEESNKYHVTFGSGIKYAKNIGSKSFLKAEAEVKDRYTFGHENILTASVRALYSYPKFFAEAEAKRILISGNQPSYFAVGLRGYYTPNKKVSFYGEGCYTSLKEENSTLKGTNVQAGFIVNF